VKIGVDIRHLAAANLSGVGQYTLALITALVQLAPQDEFWLLITGIDAEVPAAIAGLKAKNLHVVCKKWPNKILSGALLSGRLTLEDLLPVKPDIWWFPNLNIINTKLPYAITAHDLSYRFFPNFFTLKTWLWHWIVRPKKLYESARMIFAVSQSTKRDLIRTLNIPADRIRVTPLGLDHQIYQQGRKPADEQFRRAHGINFPYFLSLCTLEPRKNLTAIVVGYEKWRRGSARDSVRLGAFGVLPRPTPVFSSDALVDSRGAPGSCHPSALPHLVIAGGEGWKSKALHRLIAASEFRDQIHLIGYVPEKHKPALYRGAEALIFPSFYEGFGLPVLEAMACSTPVIATFTSSLPEIVGSAGLLIDPYRASDITQSLELLSNPAIVQLLRTQGQQQAQNFSWNKTAQLTLDALRQMC
jgi:glycosyltransferase involved in cell wall biosynthesis